MTSRGTRMARPRSERPLRSPRRDRRGRATVSGAEQPAEAPAVTVRRHADAIRQARRGPPPGDTGSTPSVQVPATPIARDSAPAAGHQQHAAEPIAIDERAALDQWLRSVRAELAGYHSRHAKIVSDPLTSAHAGVLSELLVAVEESFSEHVFGGPDTVLNRLASGVHASTIDDLAATLKLALKKVAQPLRAYRPAMTRLEDEQRSREGQVTDYATA